jgi:TetR/AcrR family tetracycline transcriptional repressor
MSTPWIAATIAPVATRTTRKTVRLDADSIVAAAVRVIDADGLAQLTMRRLGKELGVDPTAVYRHFRDKDDLLLAICDRLLGIVLESLEPQDDWRCTLRDMSEKAWDVYQRHPHLAHLLSQSPEVLDQHERLAEIGLGALRAAGLTDSDAALSYHVLVGYTAGFASGAAEPTQLGPPYAAWRRSYALLPESEFPNCVQLAPVLFPEPADQFAFGLELILDGIARLAAR